MIRDRGTVNSPRDAYAEMGCIRCTDAVHEIAVANRIFSDRFRSLSGRNNRAMNKVSDRSETKIMIIKNSMYSCAHTLVLQSKMASLAYSREEKRCPRWHSWKEALCCACGHL